MDKELRQLKLFLKTPHNIIAGMDKIESYSTYHIIKALKKSKEVKEEMSHPAHDALREDIYDEEYEAVLKENPEYSDPSSDLFSLSHCRDLAQIRTDRKIQQ
tara:strand:- start:145 stop:450 length:306 start_codon:yes stop_codon:yes gene_type:complete